MLWPRVLSALLLMPLLLAIVWIGGLWYSSLVALACVVALREFYTLAHKCNAKPQSLLGIVLSLLLVANAALGLNLVTVLIGLVVVTSLMAALLSDDLPNAQATNWLWTLGGIFYIGWMCSQFILIRNHPSELGREWTLVALLATFSSDTTAFFLGRLWGRHQLAPRISPGKSWEGAISALPVTAGVTLALGQLLRLPLAPAQGILLGLLVSIGAQLGDLGESMLKRAAQVKDAGSLIPGHGGLLDRMDSLVFGVAVMYYYIVLAGI